MSTYACNYDDSATVDDESCWFANTGCSCEDDEGAVTDNGVCDIDSTNDCVPDCSGAWGGTTALDECGVCGGSGIPDGNCDCDGNVDIGCGCGEPGPSGCDETCGSTAAVDECGVCGGSGIPDGESDCDGNVEDCTGDCGGSAALDNCGVCDGPDEDYDCGSECGGWQCSNTDCGSPETAEPPHTPQASFSAEPPHSPEQSVPAVHSPLQL
jgi:hypothetical protein